MTHTQGMCLGVCRSAKTTKLTKIQNKCLQQIKVENEIHILHVVKTSSEYLHYNYIANKLSKLNLRHKYTNQSMYFPANCTGQMGCMVLCLFYRPKVKFGDLSLSAIISSAFTLQVLHLVALHQILSIAMYSEFKKY